MRIRSLLVSLAMLGGACTTNETTLGEQKSGGDPVVINPTHDGGTETTTDAGLPCGWTLSDGFDTATITAIVADGQQVLAGTPHGLFRSTDHAQTWTRVTGFPEDKVEALALFSGSTFAIGEDDQIARHVYRSTDGETWTVVEQGLDPTTTPTQLISSGGRLVMLSIGSGTTAWDWRDGKQLWGALDAPQGINGYASNGSTEVVIAGYGSSLQYRSGQDAFAEAVVTPPTELGFDRVWNVGTGFVMVNQTELYISTDGHSFIQGTLPDGETLAPDAVVATGGGINTSIAFAASFASGVFQTSDGIGWERVGDSSPRYFAHPQSLANDGTYLMGGTAEGVKRWTSGDAAWSDANQDLDGADVKALVALGPWAWASTGQDRLWLSTDSGQTWSRGPVLQKDAQVFALGQAGSDIYAGTDRFGIFRSGDDGGPFVPVNNGVPSYLGSGGNQYREVNAIVGNFDLAVAGLSSGAIRSVDRGANWVEANKGLPIIGYDGDNQPIFPGLKRIFLFNDVFLASSSQGGLFRSTDGAQNWTVANSGIPLQSGGIASNITGIGKIGDTMYAGGVRWDNGLYGVLLRSTDNGASWVDISSMLPEGFMVNDLSADSVQLYALLTHSPADPSDGVYFSQDGSKWLRLAGPPGSPLMNQIAFSTDWLLLGTAGHGVKSVQLTTCSF